MRVCVYACVCMVHAESVVSIAVSEYLIVALIHYHHEVEME